MTIRIVAALAAAVLAVTAAPAPAVAAGARPDPAKAIATWKRAGEPDRLIIVRRATVELVDRGGVVARLARPRGTVSIGWLADRVRNVPWLPRKDQWIARPSKDVVTLSAALLMGGGTALYVGGPVNRLLLAGGGAPSRVAWIRAGKARITIDKAEVYSWNPPTGRAVAAGDGARPYVKVGDGGRLTITGSRLGYLGGGDTGPGITWSRGATGAIRDSVVKANHVGLTLTGSDRVVIDKVDVVDSVGVGVRLRGDTRTRIAKLAADTGGGDGLRVTGGASRTVDGVIARWNKGFGVVAERARALVLSGVRTGANIEGGVHLSGCPACVLKSPGTVDEPVAVRVTGPSTAIRILDAHVRGGATGFSVAPPARDVAIVDARIDGAATGLVTSATDVGARGGLWRPARTGALLYGSAAGAELTGVTIRGGAIGVRATRGTSGTRLTGLTITDVSGQAVNSASSDLEVTGGQISRAATGLALRADATLTGTRVDQVTQGVRATPRTVVSAAGIDVLATKAGVTAEEGAKVTLTASRVRAPVSLRGDIDLRDGNAITLPPFPWLGVVGLGVLPAALLLYAVHRILQGRTQPVQAPPHVLNHR